MISAGTNRVTTMAIISWRSTGIVWITCVGVTFIAYTCMAIVTFIGFACITATTGGSITECAATLITLYTLVAGRAGISHAGTQVGIGTLIRVTRIICAIARIGNAKVTSTASRRI